MLEIGTDTASITQDACDGIDTCRAMSRQRGWVSVSVQTYQSHRTSAQRITNREYTVDRDDVVHRPSHRTTESD